MVNSVAFSPRGVLLASGSTDNSVRFWSPATGELRTTLRLLGGNQFIIYTPGGAGDGPDELEQPVAMMFRYDDIQLPASSARRNPKAIQAALARTAASPSSTPTAKTARIPAPSTALPPASNR